MSDTAVAVRERPILFSGEMVRAILAGQKTQTRRVVKDAPKGDFWKPYRGGERWFFGAMLAIPSLEPREGLRCPYGVPGDRLWVRESASYCGCGTAVETGRCDHGLGFRGVVAYRADFHNPDLIYRPSIHMPRWASRITLEITGVRVERAQAITPSDARAEGIYDGGMDLVAIGNFRYLWDRLNTARGYGWDANPWIWAITFRRVEG